MPSWSTPTASAIRVRERSGSPPRPCASTHGADAEQLAAVLEDYARQPAGPQRDDIAIVAVRFLDPRRAGRTGGNGSGSRQLARSAPTLP
ncbi:MAG: hypothetical protein ACXVRW_18690 [Solirubrobacteraceae bacterium]